MKAAWKESDCILTDARTQAQDLVDQVRKEARLEAPEPFYGVGEWYEDFSQTSDAEVTDFARAREIVYCLTQRHGRG